MAQIESEKQYEALMARIDALFFETDENTPADDPRLLELDILSALVEEYEKEHFPIQPPTLSETMADRISDAGMTQKEAASLLGMSAPRLCAILGGKVQPTFEQARTIALRLHIDPAIVLA
ncbi:MAG: transcriptional regulator [Bacteroidales bacterium]|nr:transcriptional regulator [Bacteroidales bacterium]